MKQNINNTNHVSYIFNANASYVSHISYHNFDAFYVLMRNKFGRVVALYVGPHHKRSNTCVWVPKCLVTNMRAPDEDINTSSIIIPSIEIIGPITRSRAQQLNHQVNSFLYSSAYNIESRLLSNDLIVLRNQGEDHAGQMEHQDGAGEPRRHAREGGKPIQFRIAEFESNSESRTTLYSIGRPDCI
jgi:hypothetical protein